MNYLDMIYGGLNGLQPLVKVIGIAVVIFSLGYTGAPLWSWLLAGGVALLGFGAPIWAFVLTAAFGIVFGVLPLRRLLLSSPIMRLIRAMKLLPAISETEQTAIEAGTTWVDAELFSGKPDFRRLLDESYPELSQEEQAFLDGPVNEVCAMTNDWDVYQKRDLPPEVWEFIKKERFFGLIIPKEYGGHGFSATANSATVAKLMSRCAPLGTTVMVPNSLGPAELLIHYGTEEQKDCYLPRLARGEEIPCFALTEPGAGSDAGAMTSNGVVFRAEDGELYIRLNWNKRYITLAAIATVLGLAFKLRDPENLLEKGENPGITCALIPTSTPGVVLGRRHDPLGMPFYNCPTQGHDVVVSVDAIIGGPEQAGNGWRMLMESLAAGRGISLPAASAGGTKLIARVTGAYAAVRKQFGLPIGKFEGIEEPLARIGGFAYLMEAARRYTCGGLDGGQKPAVITAMAKYNFTELLRKAINDGMDIVGGAGISRGPRNLLAHTYFGVPINITVEGANILTRTLMIFGQGAIRSHPYAYKEITALAAGDVAAFDGVLWKHAGHVLRNAFRAVGLSLTRGHLAKSPVSGPAVKYVKKMAWASASFALTADLAMGIYGGNLKRMEKVSGRFADIFSWLYLGTAILRRFEAEGRRTEDIALLNWSMQYALTQIQQAFEGLYLNMGPLFGGPAALWARLNRLAQQPSDKLGSQVARSLMQPGKQRDALTSGIYVPLNVQEALGRLENAFGLVTAAAPVAKKITHAMRAGQLPKTDVAEAAAPAVAAGIINAEEAELLTQAEEARTDAIQVDSFTLNEYMGIAKPENPTRMVA